jgi:WD40 repeat protein
MYDTAKISPQGNELITFSDENLFRVWDIASGNKLREFPLPLNNLNIFTYRPFDLSPDGSKLLFSYVTSDQASGDIKPASTILMDVATGDIIFTEDSQYAFFTPDGSQFVTITNASDAGNNLKLTVRDSKEGTALRTFGIDASAEAEFQMDPGGRYIFTAFGGGGGTDTDMTPSGIFYGHSYTLDGSVKQWDFSTGDLIWEFPIASQNIVPSPDGAQLFSGANDLRSWRLDTPAQLLAWACSNRYVPEFTPEQRDLYGIKNDLSICKTLSTE